MRAEFFERWHALANRPSLRDVHEFITSGAALIQPCDPHAESMESIALPAALSSSACFSDDDYDPTVPP